MRASLTLPIENPHSRVFDLGKGGRPGSGQAVGPRAEVDEQAPVSDRGRARG